MGEANRADVGADIFSSPEASRESALAIGGNRDCARKEGDKCKIFTYAPWERAVSDAVVEVRRNFGQNKHVLLGSAR